MTSPSKNRTSGLYHGSPGQRGNAAPDELRDPESDGQALAVSASGFRDPGFRDPGFRDPGFRDPGFSAGQALAVFASAVLAIIALTALLGGLGASGVAITIAAQVIAIGGLPVAVAIALHGRNCPRALGLRRPHARTLAGAVLIGSSFWYINLWLIAPIGVRLLGGGDQLAALEHTLASLPLWLLVSLFVAIPAVCEELLMRGVVARALAPGAGIALATVVSAALFSLLHASSARLLPTFAFGLVLGYAALRTATVIPCIVMHALNNAIALLLFAGQLTFLHTAMTTHPTAVGLVAFALLIAGFFLIHSRPGRAAVGHKKS